MPKGPRGEKRPADTIGRAIMVAKIATGEIEEGLPDRTAAAKMGASARSRKLSAAERSAIAQKAAKRRWEKAKAVPGPKART